MRQGAPRAARLPRIATLRVLLHLPRLARLFWRLLRDPRVALWTKAILIGAVLYVVLPFDLLPDVMPPPSDAMAARWNG